MHRLDPLVAGQIRAREVRVVDAEGNQLGILQVRDALQQAIEAGLDLVEVAPTARPPVCRIMDFGKFKYELKKKTQRASGWTPTCSRTCASGTPVHSAMNDQPSSQAWCVMWERDGKLLISASESVPGRSTLPSIWSLQSAKAFARSAANSASVGAGPLTGGDFVICERSNSRASDGSVVSTRWPA